MSQPTDFDGAWKETIEKYLRALLELCFPEISKQIDWSEAPEFLDQELQEIVRDADTGKMRVDKLVKLKRLDGGNEWVLLHVEIQSQPDPELSFRIYQYYHRITDRFGRRVVSLVLLADDRTNWRPQLYEEELWGCRLRFEFPVCKLLDLGDEEALEQSGNPAALVVAAHRAAQRTRADADVRKQAKWRLTRSLYEHNYSRKDILELFRLIDWLIRLPEGLEVDFRKELFKYEENKRMPYITSIERLGRQEGRRDGRREEAANLITRQLSKRFPDLSQKELQLIRRLPLRKLEKLGDALLDFKSVDEAREWLAKGQATRCS